MAVKNFKNKILMLQKMLAEVETMRDDMNTSFLELECTSSEESDYNILIDTPVCELISSVEQFIENIEQDAYDDEISEWDITLMDGLEEDYN
jgi:hypothetical protein